MNQKNNWNIEIENVTDFDLKQIFDCGQCFRWEPDMQNPQIWAGIAGGRTAVMSYDPDEKLLRISDPYGDAQAKKYWSEYLDLGKDYGEIKRLLSEGDESMAEAISCGSGIRILRQEPWETLVSFIISQNNNIPRIKKCINSLAENLGRRVDIIADGYGGPVHVLPDPETLAGASLDDLATCRLGYRAKYLIEAGRQISEGEVNLNALLADEITGAQSVEALQKVCGVGPKVANCIALFGLGKTDCFPLDVWMKRVMNRVYGIEESDVRSMKAYAEDHFGAHGGIAQQYLFNFIARQ